MKTKAEDKPIEELKKEWQKKYGVGNLRQLTADDKSVFVFDPTIDFNKAKIIVAARQKGISFMVDAILNNCWLAGDESLKADEAFKQGIEDQVDEMIDLPELEKEELENGNLMLVVNDHRVEIRKVSRQDKRYAEDRNPDKKPLMTAVFLLDKIVVDKEKLDELMKDVRAYLVVLLEVRELKDKKWVELKKF